MTIEADNLAAFMTKSTCRNRVSKLLTKVKLKVSKDSKVDASSNITKYKLTRIGSAQRPIRKIENVS